MKKWLALAITHLAALGLGFALGVYALPILIAQPAPAPAAVTKVADEALLGGYFDPALTASDWLHWGEGEIWLSVTHIALRGRLAPGPDYRLYLSPRAVTDAASFHAHREQMTLVGDVRGFDGFVLPLPPGTNPADFQSAVVWCEAFGQFISATALHAVPGGTPMQ